MDIPFCIFLFAHSAGSRFFTKRNVSKNGSSLEEQMDPHARNFNVKHVFHLRRPSKEIKATIVLVRCYCCDMVNISNGDGVRDQDSGLLS